MRVRARLGLAAALLVVIHRDAAGSNFGHSLLLIENLLQLRGPTVSLRLRAERVGTFPFYCNLLNEDGYRKMRGELVVKPRP